MNDEIILPGIGVGGMTDVYDIKVLICYLLNTIKKPITKEQFQEIFQDDKSLVNYFSFCEAFASLEEKGSIKKQDDSNGYVVMQLGKETAEKLYKNLPSSLRENVIDVALKVLTRIKIESENEVNIYPYKNGYNVRCIIHDIDYDLLNFEIFVADILMANKIKELFLKDPTSLYKNLINFLLM